MIFIFDGVTLQTSHSRILATVFAVAMTTGLVKYKASKNVFCLFQKNPVIRFFHHLPTSN